MKKLAFFPVIGLLTLVLAGCYHYYPTITVRASGGPKAVLENIPGVVSNAEMCLANATPLYLRFVVLNEAFDVDPDSSIYDSWGHEFYNSTLPVAVYAFSDKDRKNPVGGAESVLKIGMDYVAYWPVKWDDMTLLDKDFGLEGYPSSFVSRLDPRKARKVSFPTIKTECTTMVQIINRRSSTVSVFEAGPMRSDLAKGGVSRKTYSFVKNRKMAIEPNSVALFEVNVMYDETYGQSVIYWIEGVPGRKFDPMIVDISSNSYQGPRSIQFVID